MLVAMHLCIPIRVAFPLASCFPHPVILPSVRLVYSIQVSIMTVRVRCLFPNSTLVEMRYFNFPSVFLSWIFLYCLVTENSEFLWNLFSLLSLYKKKHFQDFSSSGPLTLHFTDKIILYSVL